MQSRDLDASGPAKASPGGQVLTANHWKYFFPKVIPFLVFIHKLRKMHLVLLFGSDDPEGLCNRLRCEQRLVRRNVANYRFHVSTARAIGSARHGDAAIATMLWIGRGSTLCSRDGAQRYQPGPFVRRSIGRRHWAGSFRRPFQGSGIRAVLRLYFIF